MAPRDGDDIRRRCRVVNQRYRLARGKITLITSNGRSSLLSLRYYRRLINRRRFTHDNRCRLKYRSSWPKTSVCVMCWKKRLYRRSLSLRRGARRHRGRHEYVLKREAHKFLAITHKPHDRHHSDDRPIIGKYH